MIKYLDNTSSTVFKPKSMGESLAIPVVGVGQQYDTFVAAWAGCLGGSS